LATDANIRYTPGTLSTNPQIRLATWQNVINDTYRRARTGRAQGRRPVYDFQGLIFRSAARWPEAISIVAFGVGLLYALQGFRFARFLLPVTCVGGALAVGTIAASATEVPLEAIIAAAAILGTVTLLRFRLALVFSSMFTGGALCQYLAVQVGIDPKISLFVGGVGLAIGGALFWVCRRSLPILVTIVQGAGLLVVGFVGLSAALVPTLGLTFVEWATRLPLMVPTLMVMLSVLGYSVQASSYQGDVKSGGSLSLRNLEQS
jgi:hypothetical protein